GHEAGDIYIKNFADDIKKVISNKDYFYRYGGDEFILITRKDKESIRELLVNVRDNAELAGKSLFTFGISCFNEDGTTLKELIRIADERMYQVKKK
ncbi:MAG: GGDEF domain-containing protein, partial [Bacilli bacterium]|nr:GGDEF domain-containing protein [Bacilli bacterium]